MIKSKSIDMTQGSTLKHLLSFTLPLFIGCLFQQFYNVTDSLIVGRFVSADALAATGSCSSLNFLFYSLAMGLANGVGIIVSQYFGAGNDVGIRTTIGNALYVLSGAALLATIICVNAARPILVIMHTPELILDEATIYLSTTSLGILFIALYNLVAAVLRALGDSKTPLIFLIVSAFLNVIMDLLFVLVFKLGVFGVAAATISAQFLSAVISLIYAFRRVEYFKLNKEVIKPHKNIIFHIFKLGIPMALQSSMISVSLIILQGVVNTFGTTVMAAYTITARMDNLVSQLYSALSMALTTYSGQNKGAHKNDRIKKGLICGLLIVYAYNLIASPVCFFFSKQIAGLFVTDPGVIECAAKAMKITAFQYFALATIYVPRAVLNGCGDAFFAFINGLTEVVCRIVFANLFTSIVFIGVWGIWWAAGLTWIVTGFVNLMRYVSGRWKKVKIE